MIYYMRIYIDGIFDLFHYGHLESFRKCHNLNEDVHLIVGVINDDDAEGYKRRPIINEEQRYAIVENVKYVNEIIRDAPLIITEKFIEENNIDLVVHGFSNDDDWNKQKKFFEYLIKENKFERIEYYDKISTTEILNKIKSYY